MFVKNRVMVKKILFGSLALLTSINLFSSATACTLFASVMGKNDATLIAKNRDEHPTDIQSLVAFQPQHEFKYVALVSQENKTSPFVIRSGINQYGLSIVNAATMIKNSASYPDNYADGDDFMRAVLTQYKTVKQVVSHLDNLVAAHSYAEFYLLADREHTALIELSTDKKYTVKISNSAPLYHTNSYITPAFQKANVFNNQEGSLTRYKRIERLMNAGDAFSVAQFQTISHDQAAGYNDSIFRTGKGVVNSEIVRTLASFIAKIPHDSKVPPALYLEYYPKGESNGTSYEYVLSPNFWKFNGDFKVINSEQ